MTQTTDTVTATGSWVAPAGVNTVKVECWGAGGAGGGGGISNSAGGGAAGGCYVVTQKLPVVAGTSYTVTVGTGGVKNSSITATNIAASGNDSWFNTSSTIIAKGGVGGQNVVTAINGTAGSGSTTGCIGDTSRAGGNGAAGVTTTNGGGGGGGAGTTAVGGNASTSTAGSGGATGGGAGSNGTTLTNAAAATVPGGGGGGARATSGTDALGGTGADGQVKISYEANVVTQNVIQDVAVIHQASNF